MEHETVSLEGPDANGVVTLTLNRPQSHNSVTRQLHDDLMAVIRELRNPEDVGAVVLTGAGKSFCAGGDISMIEEFGQDERFAVRMMEEGIHLVHDFLSIRPPVVCAVNGPAMGLGATLVLACDIAVMADSAIIADTHVKAGIVAGDGGTVFWPLVLGPARAKEFLMTGDPVDAETALRLGLVGHVAPADKVLAMATEIATRLATGPRHAIAWTKQAINVQLIRDAAYQLPMTIAQEARTMAQPDMAEGTTALREKRAPVWPSSAPPVA